MEIIIIIDAGVANAERYKLEQAAIQLSKSYSGQHIEIFYAGAYRNNHVKTELASNLGKVFQLH